MGSITRQAGLLIAMSSVVACNALIEEDDTGSNSSASGQGGAVNDGDLGGGASEPGGGGPGGGATGNQHCGDGVLGPEEACDDGNDEPGDGCFECELECGPYPEVYDDEGNRCYLYVPSPEQLVPWAAAAAICDSWGGELVTLSTPDEIGFLTQHLEQTVWTAGVITDGEPSWPSEPWQDLLVFLTPPPDNACVAYLHTLFALPCEEPLGYICERGPESLNQ